MLFTYSPGYSSCHFLSFLAVRTQATNIGNKISAAQLITCSIVQGSGLGPYLYIIYRSGLKTLSEINMLLMYADYLVPQNSNC